MALNREAFPENPAAEGKIKIGLQKAALDFRKVWPPKSPAIQNRLAADYASLIARDPGMDWVEMAGTGVCWDAVLACAEKTGIVNKGTDFARTRMVTAFDARVRNANDLRRLEPGMVLGFLMQRARFATPCSRLARIRRLA